jgi:hypothetical protein
MRAESGAVLEQNAGCSQAPTLMLINKQLSTNASATITLKNFAVSGPIAVYQVANPGTGISALPSVVANAGQITATLPQQSITLLVIPGKTLP